MNMQPAKQLSGRLPNPASLALLLVVFFLAGCSNQDADSPLHQKLFRDDSTLQDLQRYFMPESYWQEKIEQINTEVGHKRELFKNANQAYRDLLAKRRQLVTQALTRAKEENSDPRKARQEIIRSFRDQLDPLRLQTREAGKILRQKTELLGQAQHELLKARN